MNPLIYKIRLCFISIFFLTTFCALAVEGGEPLERKPASTTRFYVWASAEPLTYLTDANVTIQDSRGNLIARGKTNHRGIVGFRLPNKKLRQLPLRVQTSGGKVGDQPFRGRLKALSYDVGERKPIIFLDLISTTARQMKNPRMNYAEATEAVRHTLSIIKRAAIDVLRVKNPYVDAGRLDLAIKTAGGYERFVRVLAQEAKQGKVMDGLKPLSPPIKTRNPSASEKIVRDALNSEDSPLALQATTSSSTNTSTLCTTATPGNGNTVANYGYIATASLMEVAGVPLSATEGVTGMLLASVGLDDTSPVTEALNDVATELDCISGQLTAIQDELNEIETLIEENTLQTELTNANNCANELQAGWNYYQALANGADGTINSANANLCELSGSVCGSGDIATWQTEVTSCGNSINNALFGTQGDSGGSAWAELNILTQSEYPWYTQTQAQALQSFLSYWGTTMYQQFVLQNEVFNFYGQWSNAVTFSGGPGTNSTACAYGTLAGGTTACQWQSNVQFAFPGNLYSDEIGLWNGTAINAFPGGLTLSGTFNSTTGYSAGYLANLAWTDGGYGDWSYSYPASTLAANAQTTFNNQGINPAGNAAGIETYESPQALRTMILTSSEVSALQTTSTNSTGDSLTASEFFFQAINQINGWPPSTYSAGSIGYYTSDNSSTVSGSSTGNGMQDWENVTVDLESTLSPSSQSVQLVCFADFPTCTDATSPPILAVLMGRTWWSGANNATNTNFYSLLPEPLTVPNTPVLTGLTPGDGQITVAFDPVPSSQDGGMAISGYVASCGLGTGTPINVINTNITNGTLITQSGMTSPLIVQGLVGGSTYTCVVQALNAGGLSGLPTNCPISSCSTTPSAATVPGAPQSLTAWIGYLQVSLTFQAPATDGGAPITGYQATCTNPQTGAIAGTASGTSSPLVVTGLTGGTTYNCSVVAQNSAGNSLASSTSATASYMTAPTLTSLLNYYNTEGEAEFLLGFTGSSDMGGTTITSYAAFCVSTNAATQQIVDTNVTVATLMANGSFVAPNSFTMDMVGASGTGGYTYECAIQAEDSNGEYSPLSNVLTAAPQSL
jgi:hypothetical protein